MHLHNLLYFLQVLNLLQILHDDSYLVAVVNLDFDIAFENPITTTNGNLLDIDVELIGYNLRDIEQ